MDREQLANLLENQKSYYAKLITYEQWRKEPRLFEIYGQMGFEKCLQDTEYHLSYLAQAIAVENPLLFTHYIEWAKILYQSLNLSLDGVKESLSLTKDFLVSYFETEGNALIKGYLDMGIQQLETPTQTPPSYLDPQRPLSNLARQYLDLLIRWEGLAALQLIQDAVAKGTSIRDLYLQVFEPCQHEIGRLWHIHQISIAQEHYCTATTKFMVAQLYPLIFQSPRKGRRMVAVCVRNELHDVGLRIVTDFFEMEGWEALYIGANTPAQTVVDLINTTEIDLLAISATIPTHIRDVETLIRLVRQSKGQNCPKILAGGYPFNLYPDLWLKVGADGYAMNAEQAVTVANTLINSN